MAAVFQLKRRNLLVIEKGRIVVFTTSAQLTLRAQPNKYNALVSDPVKGIANADYGGWNKWYFLIAAAARLAAIGVVNAKYPGK